MEPLHVELARAVADLEGLVTAIDGTEVETGSPLARELVATRDRLQALEPHLTGLLAPHPA